MKIILENACVLEKQLADQRHNLLQENWHLGMSSQAHACPVLGDKNIDVKMMYALPVPTIKHRLKYITKRPSYKEN